MSSFKEIQKASLKSFTRCKSGHRFPCQAGYEIQNGRIICVQYNNKGKKAKKGTKFYGQVNFGKLPNLIGARFVRGRGKMKKSTLKKKRFELHCGTHATIPDALEAVIKKLKHGLKNRRLTFCFGRGGPVEVEITLTDGLMGTKGWNLREKLQIVEEQLRYFNQAFPLDVQCWAYQMLSIVPFRFKRDVDKKPIEYLKEIPKSEYPKNVSERFLKCRHTVRRCGTEVEQDVCTGCESLFCLDDPQYDCIECGYRFCAGCMPVNVKIWQNRLVFKKPDDDEVHRKPYPKFKKQTETKCPVWYSKLNQNLKKHIKSLIGEAASSTRDLENLLMDECGTDRKDAQDLLTWWFGRQQKNSRKTNKVPDSYKSPRSCPTSPHSTFEECKFTVSHGTEEIVFINEEDNEPVEEDMDQEEEFRPYTENDVVMENNRQEPNDQDEEWNQMNDEEEEEPEPIVENNPWNGEEQRDDDIVMMPDENKFQEEQNLSVHHNFANILNSSISRSNSPSSGYESGHSTDMELDDNNCATESAICMKPFIEFSHGVPKIALSEFSNYNNLDLKDFGLAMEVEENTDDWHNIHMIPAYRSPEVNINDSSSSPEEDEPSVNFLPLWCAEGLDLCGYTEPKQGEYLDLIACDATGDSMEN